ncbi:hypothetical protein L1887_48091 [Cichorium endivia]|nr:hypothetical protein L1887_48091 [Cichorium endivia]
MYSLQPGTPAKEYASTIPWRAMEESCIPTNEHSGFEFALCLLLFADLDQRQNGLALGGISDVELEGVEYKVGLCRLGVAPADPDEVLCIMGERGRSGTSRVL